ncbi:MAG: hypothetical protein QGG64_20795 [Candidatus Latescibacteria bacterium]|jgi:hypothetical protein|nr:hypothetical protein [Candidatus Latescibacterota bacterium]
MPDKVTAIFKDYEEANAGLEHTTTQFDTEQEAPVEKHCCITGEDVKTSFCRYPDPSQETMMIMSKAVMLQYSRSQGSLANVFEQVLTLRRKQEK